MTNPRASLVQRLTSTPLRKATSITVGGAALSLLFLELLPQTRKYGIQHILKAELEVVPAGFVAAYLVSYLQENIGYVGDAINNAYQKFKSR